MRCLDDRETQMEEETIFVTFGQRVLQVGINRTVIMFYSDYQKEDRCVPASTPPPITHYNPCPPTSKAKIMKKNIYMFKLSTFSPL